MQYWHSRLDEEQNEREADDLGSSDPFILMPHRNLFWKVACASIASLAQKRQHRDLTTKSLLQEDANEFQASHVPPSDQQRHCCSQKMQASSSPAGPNGGMEAKARSNLHVIMTLIQMDNR